MVDAPNRIRAVPITIPTSPTAGSFHGTLDCPRRPVNATITSCRAVVIAGATAATRPVPTPSAAAAIISSGLSRNPPSVCR